MIEDGQYRGGYLPYGYKLVHKGRTNKKISRCETWS